MYNRADKLLEVCAVEDISIAEATLRKVILDDGKPREYLLERFAEVYQVMKESSSKGIEKEVISLTGITGGNGKRMMDYNNMKTGLSGELIGEAMARAFSTLEVNGAMGKIVAAPTAGASGILPAALVTVQNRMGYSDEEVILSLFTASAIGAIIAMNATIAGAEGGCQAETGAAAAMAAAALVELTGGSPEEAMHAASFAIINLLGLVCDPLGGLVEFPCALRNASGVTIALSSCDMARAGIKSLVPFDEVVEAMHAVGQSMPAALRETALGGLAATETGRKIAERSGCSSCNRC